MLQMNFGDAPLEMTVFNPSVPGGSADLGIEPVAAPCSKTERILELFEEITGWKAAFAESKSSLRRRAISSSKTEPAHGSFSIVDMSEHWPAQKPTCHREKCDQLVALIDQLVGELHLTQVELGKAKSTLVALDPMAEINEDELVDSFIPKFNVETTSGENSQESAELPESANSLASAEEEPVARFSEDFEVRQQMSDDASVSLVCPPFEGWSLGGATGIVGNDYLDWMVDDEERISICAGEIDSAAGADRETVILIDPLTNEYQISVSQVGGHGSETAPAFYLWDSKTFSLSAIHAGQNWERLKSHQAIVATTAAKVGEVGCWKHAFENHLENATAGDLDSTENISASELAELILDTVNSTEPLLVLKRG